MERLTIRSKNSDMVWFKDAENGNAHLEPCEMTAHHNRMALDKLATYEDAEEQGLLLRLPISEDTPVYSIEHCSEIEDAKVVYDVDAVVEQLDEYITKIVGRKSALYQTVMQIVKGGGVDAN